MTDALNAATQKVAKAMSQYKLPIRGDTSRTYSISRTDARLLAKVAIEAYEMAHDVAAFDEAMRKLASGEDEIIPFNMGMLLSVRTQSVPTPHLEHPLRFLAH